MSSGVGPRPPRRSDGGSARTAAEICGLVYGDPERDWEEALCALQQELRDLRYERRALHVGDMPQPWSQELITRLSECDQEAEQILLERINAAIRRWNERIATEGDDDPPQPEETPMATTTAKRTTTALEAEIFARYNPAGELQWFCPQCGAEHPEQRRICTCEAVRPSLPRLREAARLMEQLIEAGAVGPNYRSRPPDLSEDSEQRRHQLEALLASYSADILPRIRKPVKIAGREFVCVGGTSMGTEGYYVLEIYEAIPRDLYAGPARTWRQAVDQHEAELARDLCGETSDEEQVDATLCYDRLLVTRGSEAYVLVGPEHELDGEGIGAIEPKPVGKTRRRKRTAAANQAIPETQAEAQAKEERLDLDTESTQTAEETITLEFSPKARCEAAITLRRSRIDPETWFDRIDQSTSWQQGEARASTEMLSEHFPGVQTSRAAAIACAFHRLREKWEAVAVEILTPEGRRARALALRQLATARRRLLGEWAGPPELQQRAQEAGVEDQPQRSDNAPRPSASPPPDSMPLAVPVSLIRWRDDNPRGAATDEEIARKAATLEREGQLAPIGVRALADGTLEGWWGERRYRAALLLKWEAIQAVVFPPETPDLVLRGKRAAENLDQEDLDPIARARHLRERLLALGWTPSGDGKSLRQAAREIGLSQGDLSIQLGLLKLPPEWQQRLIAREITPTQARSLLPWIGRPQVLAEVGRSLQRISGREQTTAEFAEMVRDCLRSVARPCEPRVWIGDHRQTCGSAVCELSAQQIARHAVELDLITLETPGRGREQFAFNTALFDRLNREAAEKRRAREEQRAARGKGSTRQASAQGLQTQREQQKERLARRVAEYRETWLREHIANRLFDGSGQQHCTGEQLLALLLYLACRTPRRGRETAVAAAVQAAGGLVKRSPIGGACDPWPTLLSLRNSVLQVAAQVAAECVLVGDCHRGDLPAIGEFLGVDLAAEWRVDEAFLRLFTHDQLDGLIREWRLQAGFAGRSIEKRSDLIAALLEADARQRLPAPKILRKER